MLIPARHHYLTFLQRFHHNEKITKNPYFAFFFHLQMLNLFNTMKSKTTISTETCDWTSLQECLRGIPLPFCQDHSLGILFLTVIIIIIIGLISFEMMYEDSCFSAATLFFFFFFLLRLGKSDAVNVPVCHRVCDSWWHQGAADWPSLPHAAEVERGVNASPAAQRYISVSAGASARSVCRRRVQSQSHIQKRWDIYSSRI